jgi:hypothetical protein
MREETIKTYENKIKRYKEMDIKRPREVYKRLRETGLKLGYLKNVMCAFKWKTKDKEYGEIIKEINGEIKETREEHVNKFKKLDWGAIKKPEGETIDDMIKGLYTMIPPRRLSDYAYMIYVRREGDVKDKERNYYVKEEDKFIFQNYKTVGRFGIQRFKVAEESKELTELIKRYVNKNKIKYGEAMLKYRKGSEMFRKENLGRRLQKIFGTSVDGLRHSYITYLYRDARKIYDIKRISEMMAHNIETHLTYLDKENV